MSYNRKFVQRTKTQDDTLNTSTNIRNMYYGLVSSVTDETDGGIIKVRIPDLDNYIEDKDLPEAYPMLPKFFYIVPQVGEMVRIFIENTEVPMSGRQYMGSIISQPQKYSYDGLYTALATTDVGVTSPDSAPSTFPDAKGVYPTVNEIAIIGRDNTDIILRSKEIELRAGKHDVDDNLKLNKTNPSSIKLTISEDGSVSTNIIMADKIALISHDGIPKFKAAEVDETERERIFEEGHPIARGDVLAKMLELFRKAILQHIHPYDGMPADLSKIVIDLQNLNIENILQKNVVIN